MKRTSSGRLLILTKDDKVNTNQVGFSAKNLRYGYYNSNSPSDVLYDTSWIGYSILIQVLILVLIRVATVYTSPTLVYTKVHLCKPLIWG